MVNGDGEVLNMKRKGREIGDKRDKIIDIEERFIEEMMN